MAEGDPHRLWDVLQHGTLSAAGTGVRGGCVSELTPAVMRAQQATERASLPEGEEAAVIPLQHQQTKRSVWLPLR